MSPVLADTPVPPELIVGAVRLIFGASSLYHGASKFRFGIGNFSRNAGLPRQVGIAVASCQIIAALFVLAGQMFLPALAVLAVIAAAGIAVDAFRRRLPFFKPGQGGWDYPLVHVLVCLLLAVTGPG